MADFREDAEALTHHLLGSQSEYMFSPEKEKCIAAGWRQGKTRIGCLTGIILSHYIPDNLGFIGRATGKDLKESTLQTFEEVCPPSLFARPPRGYGQQGKEYFIRSTDPNRPSRIFADYIVDKASNKAHIAGGNWGWFMIDQGEEIKHADYLKLLGRLSRKQAKKRFALANINQQGHDWWFNEFYSHGDYKFDLQLQPKVYWKAIRGNNRLAIIARSEENRLSHGGFVDDDYYDTLRRTYPPIWCARYLDGSFDDFSGKIYSDFSRRSVHNLLPFDIPAHWPWLIGIDVGGSAPWSVGVWRIDEAGNMIRTKEFYKGQVNPRVVMGWIRGNVPVEQARFIIDYENRPIMIMFQDEFSTAMEPARKDILPGIQETASWMWPVPGTKLPDWYKDTQPRMRYDLFKDGGSPRIFTFETCSEFIRECDQFIWDERKINEPKTGIDDHAMDELRYCVMSRPQPSESAPRKDKYSALRDEGIDETSVLTEKHRDRILARMENDRNSKGDFGDACDEPTFAGDFGW